MFLLFSRSLKIERLSLIFHLIFNKEEQPPTFMQEHAGTELETLHLIYSKKIHKGLIFKISCAKIRDTIELMIFAVIIWFVHIPTGENLLLAIAGE